MGSLVPVTADFAPGARGGARQYDVHGTTMVSPYLVSQRFVDTLVQNTFSGWRTFPVVAYGKKKERLEGMHGLSVTGKCGPLDISRSRILVKPPVRPGAPRYRMLLGRYVDLTTWDGTDVFMPAESRVIIVTRAVQIALKKAKLQNITLIPLLEVEWPGIAKDFALAIVGAKARGEELPPMGDAV